MPCPYFEPDAPLARPAYENGRLPLIEEHSGKCLRTAAGYECLDYAACNQGYARGICANFPSEQANGAFRYSLVRRSGDEMEILWISEEEYSPIASRHLHFSITGNCVLEHEIGACIQAQVAAFCQSYLRRVCAKEAAMHKSTKEQAV